MFLQNVSTYAYTLRYNSEERHSRELWMDSSEASGWDIQIVYPIMGSFYPLYANDGLCVMLISFIYYCVWLSHLPWILFVI
jgi:hypothetical protein